MQPHPLTTEIRVLAFDPGITSMGWSLLAYDLTTGKAAVLARGTLTGQHLLKERKDMQNKFSKAFIILEVYYEIFCRMLRDYQPQHVVAEGAFHHKFAQTYASLKLVLHTLRRACWDVLGFDLYEIAPMETKKLIAGNHMADKTLIFESDEQPLDNMTEHEYDATGHGLTFIHKILLPTLAVSEQR